MSKILLATAAVVLAIRVTYVAFTPGETFDPGSLKGRKVVVTGASSGIGEQMAYYYAKHGANLLITARREHMLQKVTEKCKSLAGEGITVDYIKADMSKMEEARNVVKRALIALGGIDHLMLNHAGLTPFDGWTGTNQKIEELGRIMQINFYSFVEIASAALKHLTERNGTITVTSSLAGVMTSPNMLAYSTSKYAVQGFFGGLQEELREKKANVSITIAPLGPVATDAVENIKIGPDLSTTVTQTKIFKMTSHIPRGDSAECAAEIIKATCLRRKEVFYPKSVFGSLLLTLEHTCPSLLDLILQYLI